MLINPAEEFQGTVLIVAPHMDDEILACGGTMAMLPQKKHIHVVYATDGRKSPAPIFPWRDVVTADLNLIRMRESKAALQVVGVPECNAHFLGLPEAELTKHLADLRQLLLEKIEQIAPDHIFMPFRFDRHPDHLAVNKIIATAQQKDLLTQVNLLEYFVYYRWRLLPGRDVRNYVNTKYLLTANTQEEIVRKRAALDCFKSQNTEFFTWQTRPILTPALLDDESRSLEIFLRYDPAVSGAAVFTRMTGWIRLVHRLEPVLQKWKYLLGAYLKRSLGIYGPASS